MHLNCVKWVSSKDKANPSKAPSEEVLQGADRLLLLWHFNSVLLKEKKETASELKCNQKQSDVTTTNLKFVKHNMLPGLSVKVFLSCRPSTATFHPIQYPDWNDSYTVLLMCICVLSPGRNTK